MTDYCEQVETEAARLVELATGADPATPVPACPGWTFADLVTHVGTTHRWVRHILTTRTRARIWPRDVPNGLAPGQSGDPAWLAAGTADLLAAFRATEPDTPLWSWGKDQHAEFWARRMLFELVIHRADAELALGLEPVIPQAAALDGIEEFLDNLPYAGWVTKRLAELGAEGATIHLHATDSPGEWTITQGPAGRIAWEPGHAKGDAAVRGSAGDLLLLLYGRRSPDALAVFGDRAWLDRWLATANF
ncbi:maleylpyruvate isomerase family mycothiol-dependent enzyme [Nonomuraea sp. NPDC005983]|uniref:maleylpyruvate isomerase family mycothiol-dependent enzyme n=1 Tax=Nonomuraea sp. NPDC005983 TaxID=3155595 RepID=UPI0033A569A1